MYVIKQSMCLQIFTISLILIVPQTQAIKNVRVSSDSSNLFVDRSSEVLCSYITWKQEQFYGVKWSVEYSGVEATILEYSSDGTVEMPTRTFVQADPESATEKRVELRIEHGSEPEDEVTICCEVKVLKDSGYGNMRALKKKHCSEFNVVTGNIERVSDHHPMCCVLSPRTADLCSVSLVQNNSVRWLC